MSIRLGFHRGARFVLVLSSEEPAGQHRWMSLHWSRPAWEAIFIRALQLLDLSLVRTGQTLAFGDGLGELRWTSGRSWTTIELRFLKGSARKREVIAAALLKAARYQLE